MLTAPATSRPERIAKDLPGLLAHKPRPILIQPRAELPNVPLGTVNANARTVDHLRTTFELGDLPKYLAADVVDRGDTGVAAVRDLLGLARRELGEDRGNELGGEPQTQQPMGVMTAEAESADPATRNGDDTATKAPNPPAADKRAPVEAEPLAPPQPATGKRPAKHLVDMVPERERLLGRLSDFSKPGSREEAVSAADRLVEEAGKKGVSPLQAAERHPDPDALLDLAVGVLRTPVSPDDPAYDLRRQFVQGALRNRRLNSDLKDSAKRVSASVGARLRDLELPKLNRQWSSLADAPKRQILRDVAATTAAAQHLGPVRVEFVPASKMPKGVLARVTSSLVTEGERDVRVKYDRTVQITDRLSDLDSQKSLIRRDGVGRSPMANAVSTVIEEVEHIGQQKMVDDFLAGDIPSDARAARVAKWYTFNHVAYQRTGGVDRFHYVRQPLEEQAKEISRRVLRRILPQDGDQ